MSDQNPHRCSDGGCVLLVPGVDAGMHTNSGCRCLAVHSDPDTLRRVRAGIRWLAERAERESLFRDIIIDAVQEGYELGVADASGRGSPIVGGRLLCFDVATGIIQGVDGVDPSTMTQDELIAARVAGKWPEYPPHRRRPSPRRAPA